MLRMASARRFLRVGQVRGALTNSAMHGARRGASALRGLRCLSTSTPNLKWYQLKATSQVSWRNKPVEDGQIVRVSYVARKALGGEDGFEAGETLETGTMSFRVGDCKALGALDEGVPGMRVGDMRRIRAPHTMAYGTEGKPPKIGPFESVIFDVTLTGCVHQMHIETLEVEGEDHSVESMVAAASRAANSATATLSGLLAKLTRPPPGGGGGDASGGSKKPPGRG